jgi:hypothetical protein
MCFNLALSPKGFVKNKWDKRKKKQQPTRSSYRCDRNSAPKYQDRSFFSSESLAGVGWYSLQGSRRQGGSEVLWSKGGYQLYLTSIFMGGGLLGPEGCGMTTYLGHLLHGVSEEQEALRWNVERQWDPLCLQGCVCCAYSSRPHWYLITSIDLVMEALIGTHHFYQENQLCTHPPQSWPSIFAIIYLTSRLKWPQRFAFSPRDYKSSSWKDFPRLGLPHM